MRATDFIGIGFGPTAIAIQNHTDMARSLRKI
jgi:lysine/ornithine N-monooxygenase